MNIAYINTLRFSLQLLICESFFACVLPRRKGFAWRLLAGLCGYLAAGYGAQRLLDLVPTLPSGFCSSLISTVYFFLIFLLSIGLAVFLFQTERWGYVFAAVGGYAAQHIAYCFAAIARQLTLPFFEPPIVTEYLLFRILPYVAAGAFVYRWFIRPGLRNGAFQTVSHKRIVLSAVILLSSLVLSVFVDQVSQEGRLVCRMYAIIACSLGLYIQFLYSAQDRLTWDKEEIEKLLQVSQAQSAMSSEAVEIINLKCHDLKHQLSQWQARMDSGDERAFFQEMNDAINMYDSSLKTGCAALDVVLMQKKLLCDHHHIPFQYLGNAEALQFMSSSDVASLFGNALDNAIESQLKEDAERRRIEVQLKRMGELLLIHVENACTHPPVLQGGLPQTSKEDKRYNGFGLRSIRHIAEQYGGQMKIEVGEATFDLDVLLPLAAQKP